jgi:hypothetical protein
MTAKSWDDIDLGGLTMETEDDQVDNGTQDRQERMGLDNLKKLVIGLGDRLPVILDNPATNLQEKGEVHNISPNGIKIAARGTYAIGDIVKLDLSIGKRRMIMKAEVRWNKIDGNVNVVGMQFVKPDPKDVEFLTSIFAAMHLRR